MLELLLYLVLLAALLIFVLCFGVPMLMGAPYAATDRRAVERMIDFAGIQSGETAVDLGSGDGRIVIALARAGADAHGIEINPVLVWYSRRKIREAGLQKSARIHWKSVWKADLSPYRIVTLFGITYIMKGLREKFEKELPDGARVVSNHFSVPGWTAEKKQNGVYLYRKH